MKGRKSIGAAVLAVAALLLIAIPASASASSLLQLTEEGSPAPSGAAAVGVLVIIEDGKACTDKTEGALGTNPSKKVTVSFSTNKSRSCSTEWSETGMLEEETWESNGKVKIKASVEMSQPGPCVYVFSKFKPSETEPGETAAGGETSGKLNKALSSPVKGVCEKKLTRRFIVSAEDEEEEWFGEELI